jgi:zinc protease
MRMLLVAALFAGCASAPKAPQAGRQTLRYEVAGVPVIQVIDRSLPTLRITYQFGRGADAEGAGEIGATSLLASLMTKGSGGKTAMQMAEAVDSLGASISGSASRDTMRFTAGGLSRDLAALATLLAQTVRYPNLDDEEFERLKRQALAGMKSSRTRGQSLAQKALLRLMYGDDRLGRPIGGDEASVSGLTLDGLKALYGEAVHPGELTIGVFGDASKAAIVEQLTGQLANWKPGAKAKRPAEATFAPKVRIHLVDKPDLTQVNIHLGHVGIRRNRADYEAISLLNYALGGGGFSSRLMQLIRSEKGLTYGIRSSFSAGERAGPFMITSFTRVEKVRELIDLSFQVVNEVASQGISEQELKDAKGYYLGSYPLGLETVEGEGGRLMQADRYNLGEDFISAYPKRLEAVRLSQVNDLAKKLLQKDKLVIVLVGPKDKLLDSIKDLGAVRATWWEDDKVLQLSP